MPKGLPGNVLYEYVRNKHGQSVGVLAAVPHYEDGSIIIGWSRANITNGDRFNKDEGLRIALERSAKHRIPVVPYSMLDAYVRFKTRCIKYYKDKEVLEPFRGAPVGLFDKKYAQAQADKHIMQLRSQIFNGEVVSPHEFD